MICPMRAKSRASYLGAYPLALISLTFISQLAAGSPPIDYFMYTSPSENTADIKQGKLQDTSSIYLPFSEDHNIKPEDERLREISKRILSVVQNINHTNDDNLVDLETARLAWHLMERQAQSYMRKRVKTLQPFVQSILSESNVSEPCKEAIDGWMKRIPELDEWAIMMWNSWGEFPPAGFYEGSYTDLGSYRGCLNIPDNEIIGQAQYCTLDFQPLVPTRPRYHSIFKKILDIDESTGQMIGGDFNINSISSNHTAHGFTSSLYRSLISKKATDRSLNRLKGNKPNLHNNITITTGAMIEWARKAQYFYYVRFRLGSCLPSRCTPDDVQKLALTGAKRAVLQTGPVNCMKKESKPLNKYQRIAIWILTSLALIAVLGTITDLLGYKANHNSSSLASWLLPFSLWTNARKLFDTEAEGTHTDLECIHGLRFFSMVWVIYGHTMLYCEYQSFTHFYNMIESQISNFLLLPTLNANFSVDTFFVISGLLTTYVTWEFMKGDARKFNKFAFAISRYIRLTPQLGIVILCFFLLPLLGDGPMYKQITESQAQYCYDKWWINLLYLQTYWNSDHLCIEPSWWLSIEMTFHIISMFVIVIMIKNPTKGMLANFGTASILTFWGAVVHYQNRMAIQYLPSIPQKYEVPSEQSEIFFHRPYPHAASYFIGIALGYILANRTINKISQMQLYQGWFVCALGMIISLWSSHFWNVGASYTQLQATIYYNLCQVLWPISIAWIIFACSIGKGGIVDSILSARVFVPLGRVTYMTYLSHSLVIYYYTGSTTIPTEPSMLLILYVFVANTVLSLSLGILLTLFYESPILNLQKQLLIYLTKRFDALPKSETETPKAIECQKNGITARYEDETLLKA